MNEEYDIEELAPWLVLIITLIGGWFRVLSLGSRGMGFDETFSLWASGQSVAEMLQWVARADHNPPLYYLLLHYWMALGGETPYHVRLLSVLFGAATIPVIYLTGKRLSGVLMGLAAAVILALSPFNIRFAQETRMYTLMMFNAAVAIYALARLLTDARSTRPIGGQFREYLHVWRTSEPVEPAAKRDFSYQDMARSQTGWRAWVSRHRWLHVQAIETDLAWVGFIVFSAATMLTHHTAVLFLVAANLFVLGLMLYQKIKKPASPPSFQAPSFWNWVKAQIGIFLLWGVWIFAFIDQAGRVYRGFWLPEPGLDGVLRALGSFFNYSTIVQPSQVRLMWILYAVLLGLGLLHFRKKLARFLFLAALFAIPFLGELIVSLRRPIFYDRTLIWITIPLFLILAAGVAQLRYRLLMIVVLGILGVYNVFTTGDNYRFLQKEDWKTAAGSVAKFAEKDDLVLFNDPWVQIPFDYYFKPFEDQYFIQVVKHGVPEDMSESGILETQMTESDVPGLISLLSGRKRVWLVYSHNWNTDPMGLISQTLASEMKLIRQSDFYGGQVQMYEAP